MNNFDHTNDPEAQLDKAADEIRNEPLDPRQADEAASRVWARLSEEALGSGAASPAGRVESAGLSTEPVGASAGPGGSSSEDAAMASHTIDGCAGYQALIPALVAGRLSASRASLIDDHTSECVACRRALIAARSGGAAIRSAAPLEPAFAPRARGRSRNITLGLAAAACLTIAVAGVGAFRGFHLFGPNGQAQVRTLHGSLYQVSARGTVPLAEGTSVRYGEGIRTARGASAVIQLADGSVVEMDERSEINVSAGVRDTTIALPRGNIIVQAAKRSSGHLYVASGDAMVSVTGTVFSVNHGTKGSRVSVIEGEVHVEHGGSEDVLHSGDQVSTNASMSNVPVPEEIAWSKNVDRYLALMHEMAAVRHDLNQVRSPALRYSTKLLDSMPSGTVIYAAIPNVSGTLDEANRRIQERIAQSAVLRDWFASKAKGRGGDAQMQQVLENIRAFGSELGDEIVVGVQAGKSGDLGGVVLMSELKNPAGFRSFLEREVAKLNAVSAASDESARAGQDARSGTGQGAVIRTGLHSGAHHPPVLRILPDTLDAAEMSRARSQAAPSEILLWVHDGRLIAASTPELIQGVAADLDSPQGSGFAGTSFHAQIAEAYQDGAGWLFCVDMQSLVSRVMSESASGTGEGPSAASLQQSGLLDAQQFIMEVTEDGQRTQTRGVLTFDQPRRGLASWLAAPAPMGALGFMSPDATLVAAFVVKEPVLLVDDLFAMLAAANPEFSAHVEKFESESGVSIRGDLAASFGGEFAFATDGPALPVPAWKAVFEVYDAARLQQSIERLVAKVNEHVDAAGADADFPHGRLTMLQEESGGRTFYTISGSDTFALHYVYVDGYLIAAPQRELLDRAIQNRAAGYVLASSPVFRGLLPQDGQANFSALVYQHLGPLLGPLAERLAGSQALTPQQQASIRQLGADSPATLTYAYGEENRIVFATNGEGTIASFLSGMLGMGGNAAGIGQLFGTVVQHHAID